MRCDFAVGMDPYNSSSFIDHTQPKTPSKDDIVEPGEVTEPVQWSLGEHEPLSSTPRSTFFFKK